MKSRLNSIKRLDIASPFPCLSFNVSVQAGQLPDIWKCAAVIPVHKKGSPSDPANYCLISLTCIACKLMECGIGLKEFLLLHLLQHYIGFLSRKSTRGLRENNFYYPTRPARTYPLPIVGLRVENQLIYST